MSNDSPGDEQSQSFKRNYAGTNIQKSQIKKEKTIDTNNDPANNDDDPRELFKKGWSALKDTGNAARVQAIFTVVIAITGFFYTWTSCEQWRATRASVDLSEKQFNMAQASDVGLHSMTMLDRYNTRFVITNYGILPAKNVRIDVKEDHFPSLHAMIHAGYDPLNEMDLFADDQPGKIDRKQLSKEELPEVVSGSGPAASFEGHLRRNDQWVYNFEFVFKNVLPPEQSVLCFLVKLEWDDAMEHRRGRTCQIYINAKPSPCQRFVIGLPERKPEP
jgi:hypothetical protein